MLPVTASHGDYVIGNVRKYIYFVNKI